MKIVKNDDGTVTVSVPKTDEKYDPELGGLHYEETVTKAEFDALVSGKAQGTIEPAADDRSADEIARQTAEQERHAAEAASQQLARDKSQSQGQNDQVIASEKARLSAAATVLNAKTREESALRAAEPIATPGSPRPDADKKSSPASTTRSAAPSKPKAKTVKKSPNAKPGSKSDTQIAKELAGAGSVDSVESRTHA